MNYESKVAIWMLCHNFSPFDQSDEIFPTKMDVAW